MCEAVLSESIVGRGRKNGFVTIKCHNIRDYTEDKHRRVDDKAYGGGTGMLIQAQPVYDCIMHIYGEIGEENAGAEKKKPRLAFMSPQGKILTQELVKELAAEDNLVLLCGHYEGIDQRVLDELEVEEISLGDFVVTGGELPALIIADAVTRLQEGVLPNEDAYSIESHYNGRLEYPQFTRPEVWRGRAVPEVLLSGHHANVQKWQEEKSEEVTRLKRPDLLGGESK